MTQEHSKSEKQPPERVTITFTVNGEKKEVVISPKRLAELIRQKSIPTQLVGGSSVERLASLFAFLNLHYDQGIMLSDFRAKPAEFIKGGRIFSGQITLDDIAAADGILLEEGNLSEALYARVVPHGANKLDEYKDYMEFPTRVAQYNAGKLSPDELESPMIYWSFDQGNAIRLTYVFRTNAFKFESISPHLASAPPTPPPTPLEVRNLIVGDIIERVADTNTKNWTVPPLHTEYKVIKVEQSPSGDGIVYAIPVNSTQTATNVVMLGNISLQDCVLVRAHSPKSTAASVPVVTLQQQPRKISSIYTKKSFPKDELDKIVVPYSFKAEWDRFLSIYGAPAPAEIPYLKRFPPKKTNQFESLSAVDAWIDDPIIELTKPVKKRPGMIDVCTINVRTNKTNMYQRRKPKPT